MKSEKTASVHVWDHRIFLKHCTMLWFALTDRFDPKHCFKHHQSVPVVFRIFSSHDHYKCDFEGPKIIQCKNYPSWDLQKEIFNDCAACDWVTWKTFLNTTGINYLWLQCCIGTYLSAKANQSIVRYFKKILWSQTSADTVFSDLILPQR